MHAPAGQCVAKGSSKAGSGLMCGTNVLRTKGALPAQRTGAAPPGAVYRFAPNWKEEHVLSHLADARGILQAPSRGLKANHCRAMDGYKGYAKLYVPDADGVPRLREAACWAHLRRDFHDFWTSTKSEIAREALDRIGKFYDVERDINGQSADVRHAARQKLSRPQVEAFFAWSEQQLLRIPGKSDLARPSAMVSAARKPSACSWPTGVWRSITIQPSVPCVRLE